MRTTIEYVDRWFRIERFPTDLDWISLKTKDISREEILKLAEQIAPELDDNNLFDEISILKKILPKIPDEKFDQMSAEEKWKTIFATDLPNLLKLVSKIFCIPVPNASVERIF